MESLQPIYEAVSNLLDKSWSSVQWEELRKPLYSALAARLFFAAREVEIPGVAELDKQAEVWGSYYRLSGNNTRGHYMNSVEVCEETGNSLVKPNDLQ